MLTEAVDCCGTSWTVKLSGSSAPIPDVRLKLAGDRGLAGFQDGQQGSPSSSVESVTEESTSGSAGASAVLTRRSGLFSAGETST